MSQEVRAPATSVETTAAAGNPAPVTIVAVPASEELAALPQRAGGLSLLKGMFTELRPGNIGQSLAREQDLDFMSETSAAALQGPPRHSHVVLWGALLFIIAFFV